MFLWGTAGLGRAFDRYTTRPLCILETGSHGSCVDF